MLTTVAAVIYRAAPGVGDAERRVERALAQHRGRDTELPVPSRVGAATVAIEDRRFYHHGAVDIRGLARALWSTAMGAGGDPGGSTISQQLAKLLYGTGSRGAAKLGDVAVAFKLERRYGKQRILELYLNTVYWGHGGYGLDAASRTYFGKSPARLDWAEASLLAGLPQAPSALDPLTHFGRARQRQRAVLRALVRTGVLTSPKAHAAYSELRSLRR